MANSQPNRPTGVNTLVVGTEVVSAPSDAIRVERIILSKAASDQLRTGVSSLAPRTQQAASDERSSDSHRG